MLNRADILCKVTMAVEKIKVPEWGGEVFIREMTAAERDGWEATAFGENADKTCIRARLACICLCDDKGARLFSDTDLPSLGKLSASALDRIFTASMKVNRLRKSDVEELEKN